MAKFHLTHAGPKACTATKFPCPLGGEHFKKFETASRAFEAEQGTSFKSLKKVKDKSLPRTKVTLPITPQGGGSYFGCHAPDTSVEPFLKIWRNELGSKASLAMETLKANRDRGVVYHLTAITPPELRKMKAEMTPFPPTVEITYEGIGKAVDGKNEAWFIVCTSEELAQWRKLNGLEVKDLHITLGFKGNDVHTRPKGIESLILQ